MAVSLLGSFTKIINKTTTEIVDSKLPGKVSGVLNTLVSSSFEAVEEVLKKVQDFTKETPAPAPSPAPDPKPQKPGP